MDSRRLTSAVIVHAGAFVVAVLSLGKSPMHLGHVGSANTYSAPRVKVVETRPLQPTPPAQVRHFEQVEILPLPAPAFEEAHPQETDTSSVIMTGLRP